MSRLVRGDRAGLLVPDRERVGLLSGWRCVGPAGVAGEPAGVAVEEMRCSPVRLLLSMNVAVANVLTQLKMTIHRRIDVSCGWACGWAVFGC